MKCPKQQDCACPFYNIGASTHLTLAFSGFYENHEPPPLGNVCGIVPVHRNGQCQWPSKWSEKVAHCIIVVLLIVALWRCLVAFIKALDLFHQAMLVELHRHTAMAIEMARDGGAFCLF